MPGHNHYSNCTCGWCYKTRSGSYAATPASSRSEPTVRMSDAALLSSHFVSETRSAACFVNPNATCPVCGERVYYYQNTNGSKVYFDDLGWPWPKHPCTDNRPLQTSSRRATIFPDAVRTSEVSADLVRAARAQGVTFNRTAASDGWRLAEVISVGVYDNKTDAHVSFLEVKRRPGRFLYEGTSPFLKPHSIISYKGDLVSLPDAKSLDPTTIEVRWLR